MAAYSAVVSFGQLLNQLLNSDQFPKSQLVSIHGKVSSLQSSVETIFPAPKEQRETASVLENEIRDAIYTAQDAVESFMFSQNLSSESEDVRGEQSSTSISLQEITNKIGGLEEEAKNLAEEIKEFRKQRNLSNGNVQPSTSSSSIKSIKIVGQDKDREVLKAELTNTADKLQVVPISGMAGIGKTTLARSMYEDEDIQNHFSIRAWVTVSQDYHVGEIFAKLLNSMESKGQKAGDRVSHGSDEQLRVQLHQSLYNDRYLIVIDDMWDDKVWDKVKNSLPDEKKGSRIILTTRYENVAKYAQPDGYCHAMRRLNPDESWELLCHRVFGLDHCPHENLNPIGKKIAENCGGLPLSITVIGGLLSQESKTKEYWESIGEDVNAAAKKGEDSYKYILSLSYNHLPGHLKGCFLYMGAFPEDSNILVSKLIKLWVAEGILNPSPKLQTTTLEQEAKKFLTNLIDRNLVYVRNFSSDNQIKTCGIHDTLRDLSVQESLKEKFFHSVRKYVEGLEEGAESRRRVSVHKNILMCLEKVYNSTISIKLARSLLFVGPHHHHPLPFSLSFDLLKVFDALTVYFIEFPNEVIKMIHLRYLSFTYNGKLPSSLSKLQKLQILIVRRQPKIIFVGASFLPDDIWNMPQLRHLILTETDLPNLPAAEILTKKSVLLEHLQSLSNVNAVSCTKEVLQNMPNLKKLGMWIEAPGPLDFHLDELEQLESFKFTVLNPIPKSKVVFQPKLFFPEKLRKLSLSGCGLPWEDIEVVRKLPCLEVLKLKELAFQGEEWIPDEDAKFRTLKYLLIEYLDFKCWGADYSHFPKLERLIIRHCYNLEEMDPEIGDIGPLQLIEMVDCSPEAVEWAREIKKKKKNNKELQVRIYCSWE